MNMLDSLPVSVFDLALLAVLAIGVFRGRKHGMSEELFSLITWLTIIVACSWTYEPLGGFLAENCGTSLLVSYLLAYVCTAGAILFLFAFFKRSFGGKLVGSDIFGRTEYYLGMGSGMVRFACILVALLAILNARYFSPAEVQADYAYQDEQFGMTLIPSWHGAQAMVFEKSFSGPWIKENLSFLLIKPTKWEVHRFHQKDAMSWDDPK